MQTMGNSHQSDDGLGTTNTTTVVDLSSSGNNIIVRDIGGDGTTSTINVNDTNGVSAIQTVETTYLLALYCNDILWDDVAEIAVDSAEANHLEYMDVNKQVDDDDEKKDNNNNNNLLPPVPSEPTCERPPETPLGMGMHAMTFIFGLALRK